MRLVLGLDAPTSGDVRVNGKHYADLSAPLHEVGALLEARSIHTGRSAYFHLLALAQTHGIPRKRVLELIDLVGLHEVARKRAGKFSLGMGQRLGIATALLGDPGTLLLDEPSNGLDPEGIHWMRNLLRGLAAEGRTVFVSSHLMSEMALMAEHLVVIGRGRLIADTSVDEFVQRVSKKLVRVRSPQASRLRDLVLGDGGHGHEPRAGSARDRRRHGGGDRREGGGERNRPPRALATARLARRGVHDPDERRRGVPRSTRGRLLRDHRRTRGRSCRGSSGSVESRSPCRHIRVDEAALAPLDPLVAAHRRPARRSGCPRCSPRSRRRTGAR